MVEPEPIAPRLVEVTPAMTIAGVDRLKELANEPDQAYVVSAVYMAMEYQRLDSAGELPGLFNYLLEMDKR